MLHTTAVESLSTAVWMAETRSRGASQHNRKGLCMASAQECYKCHHSETRTSAASTQASYGSQTGSERETDEAGRALRQAGTRNMAAKHADTVGDKPWPRPGKGKRCTNIGYIPVRL